MNYKPRISSICVWGVDLLSDYSPPCKKEGCLGSMKRQRKWKKKEISKEKKDIFKFPWNKKYISMIWTNLIDISQVWSRLNARGWVERVKEMRYRGRKSNDSCRRGACSQAGQMTNLSHISWRFRMSEPGVLREGYSQHRLETWGRMWTAVIYCFSRI